MNNQLRAGFVAVSLAMFAVPAVAQTAAQPAAPTGGQAQTSAQAQTLEDVRQDILKLGKMMEGLRTELLTTGNTGVSQESVGTVLQRLNALESELSAALGRVETLQNRVQKISEDATRRIGDLEFRLTELEGGDTSSLGTPVPLGGAAVPATNTGPELATDEQRSFNAALAQLDAGDFQAAADAFGTFITTYPGGPLTSEAQYRRGLAFAGMQAWGDAARNYLDSFSGAPDGPFAALALLELASSLGALNQTEQACLTFDEITIRYPEKGVELADRIATRKQQLSCP